MAKYGSTDLPPRAPAIDRLLSRTVENPITGCWEWKGAVGPHGYGVIGNGRRIDGTSLAHRVAYKSFITDIPEGLHIDHLCRNRVCVNPWHLEPVTQAVNNQRQWFARKSA